MSCYARSLQQTRHRNALARTDQRCDAGPAQKRSEQRSLPLQTHLFVRPTKLPLADRPPLNTQILVREQPNWLQKYGPFKRLDVDAGAQIKKPMTLCQ